jgi:transcriptional regulator with XRE-family HTH domain
MRTIVGRLMRELRVSSAVSLASAAERSGWSKGHLSRAERGLTRPSLALVRWYDEAFGAGDALVEQFIVLDEATREDRLRTLQSARDPGESRAPVRDGGCVPADFDARDLCLLVTETVPDGMPAAARVDFEKSWTVRNGGPVPWTHRWLTRQGNPGVPGWLASPKRVPVPDAAPGEDVVISVGLRTPAWYGTSVAYFKMTDDAGRPYFPATDGDPLYCIVQVIA